jgi:hypothetical protein
MVELERPLRSRELEAPRAPTSNHDCCFNVTRNGFF